MSVSPKKNFIQAWIVWAVVIFLASLAFHLQFISFIGNNLTLITSALLVYAPVFALHRNKESFDFFEKNWKEVFYSLKIFFLVSLVIFIPLLIANHYFQKIAFHAHYFPSYKNSSLWMTFTFNVLVVAFPEEFFFRGYLLKRFQQYFQDQKTFLGAQIGKGFFLTAFVFAFSHSLITLRWWHFSIFFPALVFGWLREKTDGLIAPILFHALSNVFASWVALHYRIF